MILPGLLCALTLMTAPARADTVSLAAAKAVALKDPYSGRPAVTVQLTAESRHDLAALTQAHVGGQVEVRVRGRVLVTLAVRDPITSGTFSVAGLSPEEAETLAAELGAGALIEVKTLPPGH
ncbi:hypothetical protein GCM10007301_00840 [Azorhizobium oxalatiphilum]|uniref:SecDF P1 head subdomain domain-containing protein n=1 Tax=Azorhizobium oxalatiphilum TaxID=980631 RepID=A0A917BH74_9HYPH|nr:hypothetical protein GCM10007301_00840 [Azorhizobium oxalatiphilum]